jgi:hypothetical protein
MNAFLKTTSGMVVLSVCLTAVHTHAFYNPNEGRWLNRDPIGEKGGENLYALNGNQVNGSIDAKGLAPQPANPAPSGGCSLGDANQYPVDPDAGNCRIPHIRCGQNGRPEIYYGTCDISCFRGCVTAHETVHLDDIQRVCPYICRRNCYLGATAFRPISYPHSECAALQAELNCLNTLLPAPSEKCEDDIQAEIARVQQRQQANGCP